MKNKILNEIHRINNIIGNENIISEQIVPKVLQKFFSVLDDDIARKKLKQRDSTKDNLIKKLRAGETLSDDAMELLLKVIDSDLLAKNLVDQKLLGDRLNVNIEKIINALKDNSGRYDELTQRMDDVIEKIGINNELPDELISAVKKDVRGRIDDGIGGISSKVDDIDISEILGQMSEKASKVNNVDDFKVVLKDFLTENRKRLTPMFTSKDIDRYVEEITGQLGVIVSKGKNAKRVKTIENLWSKIPLSEKEKLAIDSIENITKKLPLNLKNALGNPKKLIDRVIKGSNGVFEWETFWKNLKGIYFKAVLFQVLREIYKVTLTRGKQKSGYQVGYDGWVESLLDGRSYEEFIAGLIIPPVEWFASFVSYADRDTTYDQIREMLPPEMRDNFFRDDTGGMFIEQGGVKYPVYNKDNFIAIEIEGKPYKLEDVEF